MILKYISIIIFRPDQNLFTLEAILSMCAVEATHLRSPPIFKELCESKGPADCCPGWSLGGYIAVLHKRSSCFSLEVRKIYILKLQSIILYSNIIVYIRNNISIYTEIRPYDALQF